MRKRYGQDVLAGDWRRRRMVPEVDAELDLVVEDAGSGFCGAVVGFESGAVVLEDRHRQRRLFPLLPAAFLVDGEPVTLRRPSSAPPTGPATGPATDGPAARTASGSVAVAGAAPRVARASRIWVEGVHDAELVERIWGDDLRIEGVVVEPLGGIDDLPERVRAFRPGPARRLGVLVDHLVPGSKESLVVAQAMIDPQPASRHPTAPLPASGGQPRADAAGPAYLLVTGHPYVDIWQAVRPAVVGIDRWPVVPPGRPWKEGVCAALGAADPAELWRRILAGVRSYRDLETPLVGAVERLIDFVTAPAGVEVGPGPG